MSVPHSWGMSQAVESISHDHLGSLYHRSACADNSICNFPSLEGCRNLPAGSALRWAAIMQQACLLAGILTLNLCTIHVLKLFSMVQRRRYQIWCRPRLQLRRLRWCYLTAT